MWQVCDGENVAGGGARSVDGGRGSMAKFKVEGGRAGGKARIGIGIWIVTFLPRPRGFATLPKPDRCECVGGSKWPWRVKSLGRASSSLLKVAVVGSCVVDCWYRNSISIAIAASKDGNILTLAGPTRDTGHGPSWAVSGLANQRLKFGPLMFRVIHRAIHETPDPAKSTASGVNFTLSISSCSTLLLPRKSHSNPHHFIPSLSHLPSVWTGCAVRCFRGKVPFQRQVTQHAVVGLATGTSLLSRERNPHQHNWRNSISTKFKLAHCLEDGDGRHCHHCPMLSAGARRASPKTCHSFHLVTWHDEAVKLICTRRSPSSVTLLVNGRPKGSYICPVHSSGHQSSPQILSRRRVGAGNLQSISGVE